MEKMKALMARYRDVIVYLVFGVLTTAVNYIVYLPCYNVLGLSGPRFLCFYLIFSKFSCIILLVTKTKEFIMKVLVVNAGSSSLKYQLFDTVSESVLAKGNCERIGIDGSRLIHKTAGKSEYVKEMPLPDHSAATRLVVETLLDPTVGCISSVDEIEAIVFSGTKLNLDYYITQTLDDDVVDEIFDYFREEAESDSLADAMADLGSDYDEVEVRLVRIKFLCEVAN